MSTWTVSGKTLVITGATSGIGLEASVELARAGGRVVMVGRDAAKTARAVADVKARSGSSHVSSLLCDFSSQASIRQFAAAALDSLERIDVLVNNAGTVYAKRTLTEDGLEATFAVNHLGPYLATRLLLDRILASAPARIVNVSSIGHRRASMNFSNLGYEHGYFVMKAYNRSKLANVLFTRDLARRLAGTGVTVNALHPGAVATSIWSRAPAWAKPLLTLFARPFFISAEQGAKTIVYLASSPEVTGVTGEYFEKNRAVRPNPLALDEAVQKKLWEVSAELVKLPA